MITHIQPLALRLILAWVLAMVAMSIPQASSAQGEQGWLGVNIDKQTFVVPPNPYRPSEFSYRGGAVKSVTPGGPSEQAGLRPNDVIVSFNGTELREASDLPVLVTRLAPGAKVDVVVVRWNKEVLLTVTLGTRPDAPGSQVQAPPRDTDLSLCEGLADERRRAKCRVDLGGAPSSMAPAPSRAEGLRCMDMKILLEGYNCQVDLKNRCQALPTRGEAAACRTLTKTDGIADNAQVALSEAVERNKRLVAEAERKPEPPALPPKGPLARGCDAFLADLRAARERTDMADRFPMPTFEPYATKTKDGKQIAAARGIPNTEFYVTCAPGGSLSALDIAGFGAEEADVNRLSAVMAVALSVAGPTVAKAAVIQTLIDLQRKVEDAISADADRKPALATQTVNGYSVRLTIYRSRAMRLQVATDAGAFLADTSNVTDTEEDGVLSEADAPDLEHWRCDARDPDGRVGMADLHGDNVNRSGPFLRPGECIVLAQPVDLVRLPQRLLKRTIQMNRMGCYKHTVDDYRCIPFGSNTINRSGNQLIVMAPSLSKPEVQAHVDQYCSTMRRGMVDSNCNFSIQFEAAEIGSDHSETIRVIRSSEITVR